MWRSWRDLRTSPFKLFRNKFSKIFLSRWLIRSCNQNKWKGIQKRDVMKSFFFEGSRAIHLRDVRKLCHMRMFSLGGFATK